MSGQYPNQPVGGAPVTMSNFPGWNQPHLSSAQGHGVAPANALSAAHAMPPQPHVQSLPQPQGLSPVPGRYSNTAQNGSESPVPANVMNQSSQSSLSENLRHNFQMFMNQASGQSPKGATVCSSASSIKAPSASVDSSQSPQMAERDQSNSAPVVPNQAIKESNMTNQNHRVISGVGISGPFNGDIHPSTSTVSVIANASSSASNKNPHVSAQNIVIHSNRIEDNMLGSSVTDSINSKNEPKCGDDIVSGKESNSNLSLEPPCKKSKVESVGNVNSSTVGSVNSGLPSASSVVIQGGSVAPHQSSIPVGDTSSKQDALDVESQLEALFAGIADEDKPSKELKPLPESSANLQGTPNVAAVLESKDSVNKKGKSKSNGVNKTCDAGKLSSTESTPKKKRKKKPVKPWDEEEKRKKGKKSSSSKGKYLKEVSCDSGSNISSGRIRGPVVHIEGTKEAPTSLYVVNAPSRQDDEDNDSKKKAASASRGRKIYITEVAGKLSSTGLCGNSLVARYESHSSDPRWVCVFCKKGCHVESLGDLFGPYLVHHDLELQNSLDLESEMDRKKDKKNKRSGIGQTGVLGLLAIPPLAGEQPQFMVYFHENCAVWSPSINLIGSRLAGVQEAVWVAVRSKCSRCLMDGANIGCVRHGCSQQVHYPCARAANWSLDENTFISSCQVHKKPEQIPLLPSAVSMV